MFEQTFYNLLNSVLEMEDDKVKDFLESYDNFLESLLYNQELINEVKRQMKIENLNAMGVIDKKEELLDSMRILANHTAISEEKREVYDKVLDVVSKIYDKALEDFGRETLNIPIELCREGAKLPEYKHNSDAGFDIYLPEDFTIKAHETGKIAPTGLKMSIPTGYELQIRPRSGNSVKTTLRVANAPGTIDCGYADEIGVICDNIGEEDLTFKAGDRIAQGVFAQSPKGIFQQVEDINTVVGSNRNGGFGSTGR